VEAGGFAPPSENSDT